MKILFSPCHYTYDEITSGSEQSWAFNIADRISYLNKESVIITGFKKLSSEKFYKIIEVQKDKKNIDLSIKNAIIFSCKYFFITKRILKNENFDIIHHVLPFSIDTTFDLNFLFNYRKNNNYIIGPIQNKLSYKDVDINKINITSYKKRINIKEYILEFVIKIFQPIFATLSKRTLNKSNIIIAINEYTKDILIKKGIDSNKIKIIPPGIDIKKFDYTPMNLKNNEKVELLVVCYLLKRKGVDVIIKSMKDVLKYNQNVILRIVGDGPQKNNLIKLINDLELNNFVIFEGFVNNSEIQKYYKKANIFISMSRDESWGQMYLEAMACGLPIVTSINNGSTCMVKDGINGYLIEQENYELLAEKIIKLIENKELMSKFGYNARKIVENNYDWEKCIIPQYLDIYKNIINKNYN